MAAARAWNETDINLVGRDRIRHHFDMQITLPESLEARLSPDAAALHLAIGLFVTEESTLGQAAEVAGISQGQFLQELGRRRIPLHYGAEELAEDLRIVDSFRGR